jgi:hypothetical protein
MLLVVLLEVLHLRHPVLQVLEAELLNLSQLYQNPYY